MACVDPSGSHLQVALGQMVEALFNNVILPRISVKSTQDVGLWSFKSRLGRHRSVMRYRRVVDGVSLTRSYPHWSVDAESTEARETGPCSQGIESPYMHQRKGRHHICLATTHTL
jgi:hypothetical protein